MISRNDLRKPIPFQQVLYLVGFVAACYLIKYLLPVALGQFCEMYGGHIEDNSHLCPTLLTWIGDDPKSTFIVLIFGVLGVFLSIVAIRTTKIRYSILSFTFIILACFIIGLRIMRGTFPFWFLYVGSIINTGSFYLVIYLIIKMPDSESAK